MQLSDDSSMEASSLGSSYSDFRHQHDISISSSTSSSTIHSPSLSMSCPPTSLMSEKADIFLMEVVGEAYEEAMPIEEEDEEEDAVPFGETEVAAKEEVLPGSMELDDVDSSFVIVDYPNTSADQEQESAMSSEFGSVPSFSSLGTGDQNQEPSGVTSDSSSSAIDSAAGSRPQETADEGLSGTSTKQPHEASEETSMGSGLGRADGEVVLRNSRCNSVERPLSYKLATDEEQSLDNLLNEAGLKPLGEDANKEGSTESFGSKASRKGSDKSNKNKKNSGINIKRSTSTVAQSSQAAITLRRSLGTSRTAKANSSRISSSGFSLPASFTSPSTARNSFQMWSKLDDMVKKELRMGTYPAPLIGCIPPSALKVFADKEKKDKGDDVLPSSPSGQSHSGMFVLRCFYRPSGLHCYFRPCTLGI